MEALDDQLGIDPLDSKPGSIDNVKKGERPVFLTVLCILAFVGNGLSIFQGLLMYVMAGFYIRLFSIIPANGGPGTDELIIFKKVLNAIGWWATSISIGSIICLIGAILMWNLRKSGYFIYILGQLLPILGLVYFFIGSFSGAATIGAVFFAILLSLFPIAFVVMFGLNQKYLTK